MKWITLLTPDNSNLLAGVLGKSIRHLSTQTYFIALFKIPLSCYFIPRILASQPHKYRKSCSHLSLNSLFPLLFLGCIPSITTKNSQTLHPVKPTVDPQLLVVRVIRYMYRHVLKKIHLIYFNWIDLFFKYLDNSFESPAIILETRLHLLGVFCGL